LYKYYSAGHLARDLIPASIVESKCYRHPNHPHAIFYPQTLSNEPEWHLKIAKCKYLISIYHFNERSRFGFFEFALTDSSRGWGCATTTAASGRSLEACLPMTWNRHNICGGTATEADNPCTAKTPVCTLHLTLRTLHIALYIAC
jgi:hypothetical protein